MVNHKTKEKTIRNTPGNRMLYESYNFLRKKSLFLFYFALAAGSILELHSFNNKYLFGCGVVLYVGLSLFYWYLVVFHLRNQIIARNTEGLPFLAISYLAFLWFSIGLLVGFEIRNFQLVFFCLVLAIVTVFLSFARHNRIFNLSLDTLIESQQLDISRGIHNVAKAKGRHRWSKVLSPKLSGEKGHRVDYASVLLKFSFVISALAVVFLKSFSLNFKRYLMSVIFSFGAIYLFYFAVFYFVVLRFILRMEKEHGYEFRMVYEPDPVEKEPTRTYKNRKK
jgi:hypothetical protein